MREVFCMNTKVKLTTMESFQVCGEQVFKISSVFPQFFAQRNNLIYLCQFLPNFVTEHQSP